MPMQLIIGITMLWIALNVQDLIDNVRSLSPLLYTPLTQAYSLKST